MNSWGPQAIKNNNKELITADEAREEYNEFMVSPKREIIINKVRWFTKTTVHSTILFSVDTANVIAKLQLIRTQK